MRRLALFGACIVFTSCRSLLGIHGASQAELAKAEQFLGPFEDHAVPLRVVVEKVVRSARAPIVVDVCESLGDMPVTLVTSRPEALDAIVHSLAMQVGAPFRAFVGEHGEVARPTIFCPNGQSATLTAIGTAAP